MDAEAAEGVEGGLVDYHEQWRTVGRNKNVEMKTYIRGQDK